MAYSLLLTSVLFFVISDSTANQRGYGLWDRNAEFWTVHKSSLTSKWKIDHHCCLRACFLL